MGIESIVLEDHRDIALLWCYIIHQSIADIEIALTHIFQPCYHTQASTLATTRRTDQYQELFVPDIKIDIMHHFNFVEALVNMLKLDTSHASYSLLQFVCIAPKQILFALALYT